MKDKQQILQHLAQVGYAKTEAPKIAGWLVAKEITKVGEKVVYTDGEKSFGEFLDWYNESWVDEVNRTIKALNPSFTLLEDNWDFETMAKLIIEPIKMEFEMNATSSDEIFKFFGFSENDKKPKFKVGDKVKLNGKYEYEVYKVSKKGNCDYRYNLQSDTRERLTMVRECKLTKVEEPKNNREFHTTLTNSLEPYYPKCGEFFYCELKNSNEPYKLVGCKSDAKDLGSYILKHHYAYLVNLKKNLYKGNYLYRQCDVLSLRPATEDEIQQLKDKVKKEHNQEWNGTDWVDIKKSDKEMFMEWKLENVVFLRQLGSLSMSSDYKEKKLNAYAELYLFSEWVNKFYEKNEYAFLYTHEERLIIELGGSGRLVGQICFHSHEAAQRAIDCLGEQLIKTALK